MFSSSLHRILPWPTRIGHYQAAAEVGQPGLVEAVLPAGLFFGTDNAARTSQLNLTLVGPDGNPRSFELSGKATQVPAVLRSNQPDCSSTIPALVWEAEAPKDLLVETIRIDVDGLRKQRGRCFYACFVLDKAVHFRKEIVSQA